MVDSIAQTAASTVAAWLTASLSPDTTVLDRWPTGPTLPVNSDGRVKVVSVTKVGRRTRLDANYPGVPALTPLGTASARATFTLGVYEQPLQIDVWCAFDDDREDLLDQLDDVLNAGVSRTIDGAPPSDPVQDGIVLALPEVNGFVGYLDCWFDEPEIVDDPASVQASEFRATYAGVVRGAFARTVDVPTLKSVTLKVKASEESPPPAGQLYETTTITQTPDGIVVTHGTSA